MIKNISAKLKKIGYFIFDIDDTEFPGEQYDFLWDVSRTFDSFQATKKPEDKKELLKYVSKKHFIEEITIAKLNGSSLVSSNGSGEKDALTGSALFNYINSELPTQTVLIKSNSSWKILFPKKEKIYIISASSELNQVELNCLVKEIETYFKQKSKQQKLGVGN